MGHYNSEMGGTPERRSDVLSLSPAQVSEVEQFVLHELHLGDKGLGCVLGAAGRRYPREVVSRVITGMINSKIIGLGPDRTLSLAP